MKQQMLMFACVLTACGGTLEGSAVSEADLQTIAAACRANCQNKTDQKTAGGGGNAVGTTQAAARAAGESRAERDAERQAMRLLSVPKCDAGCQQLGAVNKTASVIAGTTDCQFIGPAEQPPTPGRDSDGNGVDDWWSFACTNMANRNINIVCTSTNSVAANPFYAVCGAHATADGLRICVDALCSCADLATDELVAACEVAMFEAAVDRAQSFERGE